MTPRSSCCHITCRSPGLFALSATCRQWDDRGFGGRPLVGNPQAGMFYPPVWLVWWSGAPALPRVAHGGTSPLGRDRHLCARCDRSRSVAGGRRSPRRFTRRRRSCWLTHSRDTIRTSGRPAGIPGLFGRSASSVRGQVRGRLLLPMFLALIILDRASPGVVPAGPGAHGLESFSTPGRPGTDMARGGPRGTLVGWVAVLGLSIGIAAVDVAPEVRGTPLVGARPLVPARPPRSPGVITCGNTMPGSY